jgi:mono/diheme cytochrome c family protein
VSGRRRWWTAVLLAAVVGEGAALAVIALRASWLRHAEATPVARGRRLAERMGCFGCHGPGGESPIPNPGAKSSSVPAWNGGNWMMYNDAEQDVAGWIRDGHPAGREPDPNALIHMPAYADRLGDGELADLTAYVLAVSEFGWPQEPGVSDGRDVADRLGCFGCHGPEGRGLVANPGSLKGYTPPWDGDDYPDLVESDAEFDQWVRNGITDRFRANPAARHFVESEQVKMPAFGERVSDEDLDHLLAHVAGVRAHPRR